MIAAQAVLAIAYAFPILSADRLTHSDFLSFYTGWAIVRDGQGERLYDLELQSAYQAKAFAPESSDFRFGLLPFINPPHVALVLAPFAYLSPKAAASIFLAFNCLLAAWVLYRLWQLAAAWPRAAQILLLTTTIATEVFWYNLGTGTMTLLAFVCIIEYYLAMRAGRDVRAAVWLIVAILKPQLILLIALIPLAQRRWRLAGIVIVLGLFIGLSVSLSFGLHIWGDYGRLLRQVSAHGEAYGASPLRMDNLRMILYWTTSPAAVGPLVYLALLAGVIGTFCLWRSARSFGLRFAFTVLLGLFLAPHLNYQDTVVAIFPAALGYDFARTKRLKLLPVFQGLMLAATFVPAALIITRYDRIFGWVWPTPLIVILAIVCAVALRREDHQRFPKHESLQHHL